MLVSFARGLDAVFIEINADHSRGGLCHIICHRANATTNINYAIIFANSVCKEIVIFHVAMFGVNAAVIFDSLLSLHLV